MKKSTLIKKLKELSQVLALTSTQPSTAITLLREFVNTESIKALKEKKQISARTFLNFIQTDHPEMDIQELFNERCTEFERDLLKKFFRNESELKVILGKSVVFKFVHMFRINKPVSTILPLPNGYILTGFSYSIDPVKTVPSGKIRLFDESGKQLKKINDFASTFALLPSGNVLSGTCWNSRVLTSTLAGSIVERTAEGEFIRELSQEPASALLVLPGGNIISSTSHPGTKHGEIVLRDASAQRIKTLSNMPALTLALLPGGNFLSGDCHSYRHGNDHITLHNPEGQPIKEICDAPAAALLPLSDYLLMGRCNGYQHRWTAFHGDLVCRNMLYHEDTAPVSNKAVVALARQTNGTILCGEWHHGINPVIGAVTFNKLQLSKCETRATILITQIEKLLLDNAVLACLQFNKGALLPEEILELIYSYVFPFPNTLSDVIVDPVRFASNEGGTQKLFSADRFARNIRTVGLFLEKLSIKNTVAEKDGHLEARGRKL